MSIKEMFHELINKNGQVKICGLLFYQLYVQVLTTPILGIPIGIAVYFYSFISKKVVMCLINIEIILIRKRKRNRGENEFN